MSDKTSERVNAYITERGITQQKVADVLGITWNSVHLKLSGKRSFTLQEALALAEWMGCSLDYLTGRTSA